MRSGLGPNRQPLTDKQKAQVTQQLASRQKMRTVQVYHLQKMQFLILMSLLLFEPFLGFVGYPASICTQTAICVQAAGTKHCDD